MALVLGAVLLVAGATAVPPALPAPRDLARSVLETHGQELRLLKVLGVARTAFDWGTHFSINFTARQPACPKHGPERRGCRARPGRAQRCAAQVSVFAFLPDVPLSLVECGPEPLGRSRPPPLRDLVAGVGGRLRNVFHCGNSWIRHKLNLQPPDPER